MKNDISTTTTDHMEIETDGALLPLGAMAVFPCLEEDLVELVSRVPVEMAGNLARLAAWRAMGVACDWQGFPAVDGGSLGGGE